MAVLDSVRAEAFCNKFVENGGIGMKAAIDAGYSVKCAGVQANRLLKKDTVKARIAELRKKLEADFDISRDRLVKRLMQCVFTDLRQFFDEDGNLLPVPDLEDDAAGAIISLEVNSVFFDGSEISKVKKIRRNDPIKAAELIAKIMGYMAPEKKVVENDKPVVIDWN